MGGDNTPFEVCRDEDGVRPSIFVSHRGVEPRAHPGCAIIAPRSTRLNARPLPPRDETLPDAAARRRNRRDLRPDPFSRPARVDRPVSKPARRESVPAPLRTHCPVCVSWIDGLTGAAAGGTSPTGQKMGSDLREEDGVRPSITAMDRIRDEVRIDALSLEPVITGYLRTDLLSIRCRLMNGLRRARPPVRRSGRLPGRERTSADLVRRAAARRPHQDARAASHHARTPPRSGG